MCAFVGPHFCGGPCLAEHAEHPRLEEAIIADLCCECVG